MKMSTSYESLCQTDDSEPVTEPIYRRIFNTEYNLSFHKPMKDQCDVCTEYKNATPAKKESLASSYELHMNR